MDINKKTCKVYCTYFGDRRGVASASPENSEDALNLFKINIENDLILNPGVENMDIVIINNKSTTSNQECNDYLDNINNSVTPYGIIKVLNRENKGGSLGAYSYAFDNFENEYDYWFFVEDDVRMIHENYYRLGIDEFSDDKLGFLSLTLINYEDSPNNKHVSGGFGFSKKEILKKVKEKYGKLPYDERPNLTNYGGFGESETYFTNCFIQIGYDVRIPKNVEILPLADNWFNFPPQSNWQKIKNFDLTKTFLYHIGK